MCPFPPTNLYCVIYLRAQREPLVRGSHYCAIPCAISHVPARDSHRLGHNVVQGAISVRDGLPAAANQDAGNGAVPPLHVDQPSPKRPSPRRHAGGERPRCRCQAGAGASGLAVSAAA